MKWGLVPPWAKSPAIGARMFNARVETVATSRAYGPAFAKRRCLVAVDAFYEWSDASPGRRRQPYAMMPTGHSPIALAGLWERWLGEQNEELLTFTVITTPANPEVARLHDRMPAILAEKDWERWLDPGGLERDKALGMLTPAPEGTLEAFPVSTAVNNATNDGPGLLQPVSPSEPTNPQLFPADTP